MEACRIEVEVDGDQVAGYREFVKVPEQWTRDYEKLRSRNNAAQIVDEVFWILLSVAMLVILIRRLRDRDVPVWMSLAFGGVAAVLYLLGQLNAFSLAEFGYRTTDSYSSFVTNYPVGQPSCGGRHGGSHFLAGGCLGADVPRRFSEPNLAAKILQLAGPAKPLVFYRQCGGNRPHLLLLCLPDCFLPCRRQTGGVGAR